MNPILLHIPHDSTHIPAEWAPLFELSSEELLAELLKVTDWYTDELYQLPNAERLVFPVSRLLVDPERFANDAEEVMASKGLGAVYTRTQSGQPLKGDADREKLMAQFYHPHHELLSNWARLALAEHGRGLIIDCHSYPSEPLPCDLDQRVPRPDFCVGTSSFHTPGVLTKATVEAIRRRGFSVEVDRPYAGTIVPLCCYKKEPNIHSIMIEINRSLYMNEKSGEKSAGFDELFVSMTEILAEIEESWLTLSSDG